jgi:hypothetical protein
MSNDIRHWISLCETVTHSAKFRQWFTGSKIFDDDPSQPLVVHHFTYSEFKKFDRMFAARYFKRNPESIDTLGSWFTTNPDAKYTAPVLNYADGTRDRGRRMDCYLRITNPFYMDDLENGYGSDAWSQLAQMVKEFGGSTGLRNDLKRRGYDGIVLVGTKLDGYEQTVIVAFEPNQIKIIANNLMEPA